MNEAKNVNTKKADLIRDMVVSISKIPDGIQREGIFRNVLRYGYFRQVLLKYVSAISSKDVSEVGKQKQGQKAFEVVKMISNRGRKVDVLYRLERKIIEILFVVWK
jgi:DNA primase